MSLASRSNLSQRNRNAIRLRNIANQSTADEQEITRREWCVSIARLRASQTQEQREAVRQTAQLTMRNRRTFHTHQQRANLRRARRNASSVDLNRVAFQYDCTIDYNSHPFVRIVPMDVLCDHCGTLKFAGETPGLCCLSGKVKLSLLPPPPEPLHSLFRGETPESRNLLSNTQSCNGCFQMTSFGADIIEERGFNPTFKVISARESKRSFSFGDHKSDFAFDFKDPRPNSPSNWIIATA